MEFDASPVYNNLISPLDVNRSVNAIEHFSFESIEEDARFLEFLEDMQHNNDSIELNLIKNNAYKESVMISLHINESDKETLMNLMRDEQKTFGGSKLFYINEQGDKISIVAVPGSVDGKVNMVISRLSKINEKIHRMNTKIKKENTEMFMKRNSKDKKDKIINMINKNLKV